MAVTQDFYRALASEKPLERLRRAVARELEVGVPRERLIAQLEDLRADLRASGREDDEDVVLEVMDFLTGWSSPHMRL
jgi:Asp-tRNA(Asn)/Glu-tRNA(Gln) amidotransferase A subunit family amidase